MEDSSDNWKKDTDVEINSMCYNQDQVKSSCVLCEYSL